ncbi:hypothetical protein [Nonomuraea sp. NPDC005692]|uniref:hypothetical protein n=1 Tax=Nonomuraea sp. NPDC005692 TaxID=3157168 RepID=UPI0033FC6374
MGKKLGIAAGLTVPGSPATVVHPAGLALPCSPAAVSVVDGGREAAARGDLGLLRDVRAAFTGACDVAGLTGVAVPALVLVLTRARRWEERATARCPRAGGGG